VKLDRAILDLIRRDVAETVQFLRAREDRFKARGELVSCSTAEDFWAFTHRNFVRGAAQNIDEISSFVRHASGVTPRVVVEIGVQDGGTNFILSRALPTVTTMVGIDLYVSLKTQLRFFRRPDVELRMIEGSSHSRRTRGRLERLLKARPIDVLFIDGDHTYEGALRDFELYSPFVRPGGLIAFHDIVEDSYTRTGIRTEAYVGEVPALWQRVRALYPHREFVDRPDQDGRGIGVIEYDPQVDTHTLDAGV
jgi:cephalosporin hydroxylase